MGNYMDTCIQRPEEEEKQQQRETTGELNLGGLQKDDQNSSTRIKIVLTKVELEWLLFQLKDKEGKSLEDVLGEIERSGRGKAAGGCGWKPSLESITESPELQEMDR